MAHNISGVGFKVQQADSVYFINYNAYYCCDSLMAYHPGANSGGFVDGGASNTYSYADSTFAYLSGCRAWMRSDQEFAFTQKDK